MTINDHINKGLTVITEVNNKTIVNDKEWGATLLETPLPASIVMDGIRFQKWFKKAVGIKN